MVRGRRVLLFQVRTLHADGERAVRTGLLRTVAARLLAGAAVVLGWTAAGLPAVRPERETHPYVLMAGFAALGCWALWTLLLWRNAVWVRRGLVTDAGTKRLAVSGLDPAGGDPEWMWAVLRTGNVLLMGVPIGGLLLALGVEDGTPPSPWWCLGGPLVLTGLMGAVVSGFGLGASGDDCWTPLGALGWLLIYGVPFLLAVPWLSGTHRTWSAGLVCLAILWLLIAPLARLAKDDPGRSSH
ncbi:hypothetical protein ACIQ6Y_14285 [Streptomyces sp. NPDC096205]|uniref:hypothetical protein n=1 Tax=Streptomyces sp. NPDC096205 TaxID=3366081 RepID=UPI003802820C